MKTKVLNLDNKSAGEIELNDAIFGLEPRADLIQRVVVWQLAKRRGGNAQDPDPRRSQPHEEEGRHAEGQRRRPSRRALGSAVRRRRQGDGPGRAQP